VFRLMRRELVGSSVVIVAQNFNPSVANQLWLVRNGVVGEGDFLPGCIFTDLLVQVRARRFGLLFTPEQIQFVPAAGDEEAVQMMREAIVRTVRTLPHTPYRALGLNFTWHLTPEGRDVEALSRQLFFTPGRPLFRDFDVPDASFGAYLSRDLLGFRLKLDVKPVSGPAPERPAEQRLQFLYNFHADLPEGGEAAAQIEQHLRHWPEAAEAARRSVHSVGEGGEA
jgi:hypothetical protein